MTNKFPSDRTEIRKIEEEFYSLAEQQMLTLPEQLISCLLSFEF